MPNLQGYKLKFFRLHSLGCLTVLKGKKKKSNPSIHVKRVNLQDPTPTTLPKPLTQTRALQSAPPSFQTGVKSVQPSHPGITTMRALSAPSTLDAAEQAALSSAEHEEHEESKIRGGGGGLPPVPHPLPLPAQHTVNLKTMGSFKVGSGSGPLLPLNSSGSGSSSC